MAMKPLRPCRHPGCGKLTQEGYCPLHRPKEPPRSREAQAYRRWYSLDIWTKDLRPTQLLLEPFCRECARNGVRRFATDVDHVKDHKGDWAKFIDRRNLQSLCHNCHGRKTMEEMRQNQGKARGRK